MRIDLGKEPRVQNTVTILFPFVFFFPIAAFASTASGIVWPPGCMQRFQGVMVLFLCREEACFYRFMGLIKLLWVLGRDYSG
jgi:hypothetical protein